MQLGHISIILVHDFVLKMSDSIGQWCASEIWEAIKAVQGRVAKFDPKVGSRRTTKIENLVVLDIILVVLILLPYYMDVVLVLILLFLLVREK